MALARHVDDASRRAGHDAIEEQVGQEKVAEVVDAEGELEAVGCDSPLSRHPCVVHQDVQGLVAVEEGLRRGPH